MLLAVAALTAYSPNGVARSKPVPRCAPPVALFDGLIDALIGADLASSLASSLPSGVADALSSSVTATESALSSSSLPSGDLASFASSAEAIAEARASDAVTSLAALLGDGANKFPSEIQAELVPLLEAKQAELLQQLDVVETLIEKSQPPTFPNDLGALAARDFVGPAATAFGLASTRVLDWRGDAKVPAAPYPLGRYDPKASAEYYAAKPWAVLTRLVESGIPASGFGAALLLDWLRGEEALRMNARVRAEQLVTALTAMGPTYIKVGQALSIRADLLPPAYITALTGLQDRVPSFSSTLAKDIMADEWALRDGSAVDDLFVSITAEPVAAASLGQVYRAQLREGNQDVAIKVQRPEMESIVSLDLLLIRTAAAAVKQLRGLNSDLVGLVDDWGRGFVDELDYTLEAKNTKAFFASIADSPLADVVTAPEVVEPLCTQRVLVTKWVDGERLERSQANDVSKLCGVALNTYLSMLLSTGLLHCDPHPGNLLRTSDGRLCILDWGLVTTVDEELQLAFLEHVAHLTAADYAKVPSDLIGLGFVPAGMESNIRDNPQVVETLASVYSQWAGGGGVAKIDVNEVSNRLQGLTEEYGNFFQIPPYFAYVLRAFSVLEGIALINDPDYSILNECLPYISQRVLTDGSPRARRALQAFVYESSEDAVRHAAGAAADDAHAHTKPVLDAPRLAKLADGFKSFSASAGGLSLDAEAQLERLAGQLVDLLLAREGSPLQDLVLDEAARLADARVRDLVTGGLEAAGSLTPAPLPTALSNALDPFGVLRASAPLLGKYEEDERVLSAAETLSAPLLEVLPDSSEEWQAVFSEDDANGKLVRFVAGRLWERRDDFPTLTARLAGRVLLRGIDRVEHLAAKGNTPEETQGRSLAATILTSGLATLSTGLVAVAPDAQPRGVMQPVGGASGGAAPQQRDATSSTAA